MKNCVKHQYCVGLFHFSFFQLLFSSYTSKQADGMIQTDLAFRERFCNEKVSLLSPHETHYNANNLNIYSKISHFYD